MDRLETNNFLKVHKLNKDLHSSMDRLETLAIESKNAKIFIFTFQYG